MYYEAYSINYLKFLLIDDKTVKRVDFVLGIEIDVTCFHHPNLVYRRGDIVVVVLQTHN